jgi:hypothetical protein
MWIWGEIRTCRLADSILSPVQSPDVTFEIEVSWLIGEQ